MSGAGDPTCPDACKRVEDGAGDRGATLMEALVVLAIVAMVGAIAFPNLSHAVGRAAFAQAAQGLRADLRLARAQAVRTGRPVRFAVAQDGRAYGWSDGPERGLLGGLRLAATEEAFSFLPDGSSSGARLRLSDGALRDDLAVDPVTGLAERPS